MRNGSYFVGLLLLLSLSAVIEARWSNGFPLPSLPPLPLPPFPFPSPSPSQQCGKQAGGAVCPDGRCCSKFGYCGDTDAYCGAGCQSQCSRSGGGSGGGSNRCGSQTGGAVCPGGRCCSKYGYCGDTDAYCGAGCQSQCSGSGSGGGSGDSGGGGGGSGGGSGGRGGGGSGGSGGDSGGGSGEGGAGSGGSTGGGGTGGGGSGGGSGGGGGGGGGSGGSGGGSGGGSKGGGSGGSGGDSGGGSKGGGSGGGGGGSEEGGGGGGGGGSGGGGSKGGSGDSGGGGTGGGSGEGGGGSGGGGSGEGGGSGGDSGGGSGGSGGGGGSESSDISSILSRKTFEEMLKHRNEMPCPAKGFYTYDAFISAAKAFPAFGTTGDSAIRKREIAAFFAQTSHETTGGWPFAPDGPYTWGYCYVTKTNPFMSPWWAITYCAPNFVYPCSPFKQYYGRGPFQLTWNYNYGQCGQAIGLDLLGNPDLVAMDSVVSFKSALWIWMTPQTPKPSSHSVITGEWSPSETDLSAQRVPGFGLTTNIINGAIECGKGWNPMGENRIGFYKRYCDMLGVDYGKHVDCYDQRPFGFSAGHESM